MKNIERASMSSIPEEFSIVWESSIPIANLRDVIAEVSPPGKWLKLDRFIALVDQVSKCLEALKGGCIKGQSSILISRNLDKLALVEYPSIQEELNLSAPTAADEVKKSLDAVDQESRLAAAAAIKSATRLLVKNDQGFPVSAEELVEVIASSDDSQLTKNALKIAGSRHVFVGAAATYAPAKHKKFPETLESETVFHLRLKKFGDINSGFVTAEFERLHVSGQSVETPVGRLLRHKRRVPVNFLGSADETLFKVGAAAQLEIEVRVTATVTSFECSICGFTLISLLSRVDTINSLTKFISQQTLPLTHDELGAI